MNPVKIDERLLKRSLNRFSSARILVIGDLILDRFVRGTVSRISPEAPVPVVDITEDEYMPGGAGNVVNNMLLLGASVYVCGIVGKDAAGRQLKELLRQEGADISAILSDGSRPTSLKTRIIAEHQQVVRADMESKDEISSSFVDKLKKYIQDIIKDVDGVIVSDYGKGVVTSDLIRTVIEGSVKRSVPVVVDPQKGHFFEYSNVTSLTPNVREAGEALHVEITDSKQLLSAGKELLRKLNAESVLITRGEEGMSLFLKDGKVRHIPTMAIEVYDVSGAGDTVASVYTLGLSTGLPFYESALLANYAASIVVGKLGTATASVKEILHKIET